MSELLKVSDSSNPFKPRYTGCSSCLLPLPTETGLPASQIGQGGFGTHETPPAESIAFWKPGSHWHPGPDGMDTELEWAGQDVPTPNVNPDKNVPGVQVSPETGKNASTEKVA